MRKIFVIYTTIDVCVNEKSLKMICKELSLYGDVFIDLLHNDSVDKQEFVFQKLDSSTDVVIVKTPNLIYSKWAQLEIEISTKNKKNILGFYKLNNEGILSFIKS